MSQTPMRKFMTGKTQLLSKVTTEGVTTLYDFVDESPYLSMFLVIFGVILFPVAATVVAASITLALVAFASGLAGGIVFAPILLLAIAVAGIIWVSSSAIVGVYRGLSPDQRARMLSSIGIKTHSPAKQLISPPPSQDHENDSVRGLRDRFQAYVSTLPALNATTGLANCEPAPLTNANRYTTPAWEDLAPQDGEIRKIKLKKGFRVNFSPDIQSHEAQQNLDGMQEDVNNVAVEAAEKRADDAETVGETSQT